MSDTKLWVPTEPPKVHIQLDKVPAVEMRLFCLSLARMAEEYLKDPKHRAECEEWKKKHCKEDTTHESVSTPDPGTAACGTGRAGLSA